MHSPQDSFLSVKKITEDSEFSGLQKEWDELLQESESNEITLTWEWLYTWWEVFKEPSRKLLIITARDCAGRLIGIAPLQIRNVSRSLFSSRIRRLEFLASGEEERDEVCSDYLDFITQRGSDRSVLSNIFDYLMRDLASEWDEMVLDRTLGSSENIQQLEKLAERNYPVRFERIKRGECFYISLPESWEKFLSKLSKALQYKMERDQKKLSKLGEMNYMAVTREDELKDALNILVNLHQKRRMEKGQQGAFASKKFTMFHAKFLPLALKNGWLQFRIIFFDGNPLAAKYNFKHHHKVSYYQSGIDTSLVKGISPGTLIESYCIKEAISDGFREYDFLSGEEPYKRHWTHTFRSLEAIKICGMNFKRRSFLATAMMRLIKKQKSVVSFLSRPWRMADDR